MKHLTQLKEWMHWRGITVKDMVCSIFALGLIVALSGTLIWAGIQAI